MQTCGRLLFLGLLIPVLARGASDFTHVKTILEASDADLVWGDIDNDGKLDLIVCGSEFPGSVNRYTKIYRNDGGNDFTELSHSIIAVDRGALALGDYDGDGWLDLALQGQWSNGTTTKIYRNVNGVFTDLGLGLPSLMDGDFAWIDYDNDGKLDLLATGRKSGQFLMRIFRNNGNHTFTDINANLSGLVNSHIACADFDKDGDTDFAICGLVEPDSRYSFVYRNDGNGVFTKLILGLPGVDRGRVAWGDYDGDGQPDLLLTGQTQSPGPSPGFRITKLYRNDNGFTEISTGMTGVRRSEAIWGDYDADGDPDVYLTGASDAGPLFNDVYRNDAGVFTATSQPIQITQDGSAEWADYDNDGRLDLAVIGRDFSVDYGRIYQNIVVTANSAPGAPGNPQTSANGRNVTFSWTSGSDHETATASLMYNLRVGTAPGKDDVMPAHANLSTGWRRIAACGNVGHNLSWPLKNLGNGTYYWSVQTIDWNYQGSGWTAEGSFTIAASAIQTASDSYDCWAGFLKTVDAPGVLGNDSDPAGAPLLARLVTGTSSGILDFRADGSFDYTPNAEFSGTDSFTYKAIVWPGQESAAVTVTLNSQINDTPAIASPPTATPNPITLGDVDP